MGVGADGAELRSEDASRRAEGAQDGRKHGALERRSGSVFLKGRARRSDKAGTWSQGVTPTKETFGLASSQKTYREPLKAGIQPWGSETSGESPGVSRDSASPTGQEEDGGGMAANCLKLLLWAELGETERQRQTETDREQEGQKQIIFFLRSLEVLSTFTFVISQNPCLCPHPKWTCYYSIS